MWLARREMRTTPAEAPAEDGVVTLSGEDVAVYAQGERRHLPVYGPGGYCWRPAMGDRVLVLKLGQEGEQCCVAGLREEPPGGLKPGEVMLRAGNASIWLKNSGTVEITGEIVLKGAVIVNGEPYKPCKCEDDSTAAGEEDEESGGEA